VTLTAIRQALSGGLSRRLLSVRILGQTADGLLQTGLASFVMFSPERQANPKAIATAFAILLLPYSLVGPFAGVLIDRWSRRIILARANVLRVITMVALAILVANHSESKTLAFFVLISLGINRFVQAAFASSIPHVVQPHHLVTANAVFPTIGTVMASLASAIGLFGQSLFGNSDNTNSWMIASASLLAASASYAAYQFKPNRVLGPDDVEGKVLQQLRNVAVGLIEGARNLFHTTFTLRAVIITSLQRFAFGALTVHTLLLARNTWHSNTQSDKAVIDFGIAAGCAALGAGVAAFICAGLLSGERAQQAHVRLQRYAAVALSAGLVITVIAFYRLDRISTFAAAFSLALAGQIVKITADTSIQQNMIDAFRGRTFSLFDMAINMSLVSGIALFALNDVMRNSAKSSIVFVIALVIAIGMVLTQKTTGRSTTL
jgi:MFS family permease